MRPKPGPGQFPPVYRDTTTHTTAPPISVSPRHRPLFSSFLLFAFKARAPPLQPRPRLLSPSLHSNGPTHHRPRPVLGLAVLSTLHTLRRAARTLPCRKPSVNLAAPSVRFRDSLSLPAGAVCFSSERSEGSSWPEPGGGAASAACMEAKVCSSVLFPLISHSLVLSLGGPRCSRLVARRAVPRYAMGLLPWGALLGSAMGISSVITRSRRVSLGSYPCFVPVGVRSCVLGRG